MRAARLDEDRRPPLFCKAMQAITRRPSPRMAECELTHLARCPIDVPLARQQHAAYRQALARCDVEVVDLAPLDDHPDSAFVEDVLIALPELLILTRPGAASRRGEVEAIEAHLPPDRPIERLTAPATLDGGDVLRVGRRLFIGRSTRTNDAGIDALGAIVTRHGYTVSAVEVPGALHLKTAVTAIANDLVLINPAWIASEAFEAFSAITVADDEPFAGNCLSVSGRVILSAAHRATAARIARAGFGVDLVDISEFAKAEAGLTCLSVLVPPAA